MSDQRPPLSSQAAHRLVLDTEPYLSCDDCFALVVADGDAARALLRAAGASELRAEGATS